MLITDYIRATAIITQATIQRSLKASWPELSQEERDQLLIEVLDRIARMRGWSIKREFVNSEEGEE
jgi:hypothetical protein